MRARSRVGALKISRYSGCMPARSSTRCKSKRSGLWTSTDRPIPWVGMRAARAAKRSSEALIVSAVYAEQNGISNRPALLSEEGLGKEKVAELGHKAVVQRGEMLQAARTRLLQFLEKEDLLAGIHLLQQFRQVGHRITASRHAQDVMDKALDELLRHIGTGEQPVRNLPVGEHLMKRNGLSRKGYRGWGIRHRHLHIQRAPARSPLYKKGRARVKDCRGFPDGP